MDPDSSFNNSGVSSTPSRPTYNNGAGYQNNNQVSQRPNEAQRDMTPNVNQEKTPTTASVATTQTDWVRFNTICNKELVDKVRAIADRNHSSIRDVIELMFRRCINAYEQKNGIITIEQKKPLEELF
jgi:hypothetical protein